MRASFRPNLRFTVRGLSEHKSPTVVAEAIADFIQTSPIADSGRATGIVYWYTRGCGCKWSTHTYDVPYQSNVAVIIRHNKTWYRFIL